MKVNVEAKLFFCRGLISPDLARLIGLSHVKVRFGVCTTYWNDGVGREDCLIVCLLECHAGGLDGLDEQSGQQTAKV